MVGKTSKMSHRMLESIGVVWQLTKRIVLPPNSSWNLLIPTRNSTSSSTAILDGGDSGAQKQSSRVWERKMGGTEVSYYLGSRGKGIEGGVNDMCVFHPRSVEF